MKIKPGNTPTCWSCYFYEEIKDRKGWCYEKYNCTHGINGKKIKEKERTPTHSFLRCHYWEDAETRTSYFDYVTGKYREENINVT